ncbi:hypothetical protein FS749_016565 [Ceratobasidium sp. UAMH 11750]|nr:hypothetical protein FS749_016565 [Ceratobasidium sp. UAMH 11750]
MSSSDQPSLVRSPNPARYVQTLYDNKILLSRACRNKNSQVLDLFVGFHQSMPGRRWFMTHVELANRGLNHGLVKNTPDCIFFFIESRGVAIPVYGRAGSISARFCVLPWGNFLPPRKLRRMDSTTEFKVLASTPLSKQLLPTPASISAVGEITTDQLQLVPCRWCF